MTTTRRNAICLVACAGGAATIAGCSSEEEPAAEFRIPTSEVPEGGGLVRDGVVITQPTAGDFHAFDARCPHQGCAVDEVTAEAISCPCHGSRFAPADGSVVQGPATQGLSARTATVDGADVVVS
ncbi:Rieske (2Fe-2S) protein [Janibacter anophelis]|uniref:Rieske (2Fe-2S) protein n=1 Tax=Janibacter anophelis TaxID=319054 RepID=UPI000DEFAEB2|nr:Rieske (2Fe-2S) protein [Janibacter anophelis]